MISVTSSSIYSFKNGSEELIDKQAYYRGAALFQLIEDDRMETIRRVRPGFIVNDEIFVLVKYTAMMGPRWQFTISSGERDALEKHSSERDVAIALVCAGDGVCAVRWDEVKPFLDNPANWIAASRRVHERYRVSGSNGEMKGRIPRNNWPQLLFEKG